MLKITGSEKNCIYVYIRIHIQYTATSIDLIIKKSILLIVYEDITDPVIYWDMMLF